MLDQYSSHQKERMGKILELILRSRELTRNRISNDLHMSSSSVVKYTRELILLGLVREKGLESSSGGRRRALLEFDPHIGLNIVVLFHRSRLEAALINPAGQLVSQKQGLIEKHSYQTIMDQLISLTDSLFQEAETLGKRIFGIGIGMGDQLDMEKGISNYYHLCPDWVNVNLKEIMEQRYSLPFFLINDINAAALGELYYGKARDISNSITLWVSETLGMGLILNGSIYLANNGIVGEIGHTHAQPEGPLCSCGNRGCLETLSTESYILDSCRSGAEQGVNTSLKAIGKPESWTIDQVIRACSDGDRFCRNVMLDVAESLGTALADTANILNPQRIILGGSVMNQNQFLLDNLNYIVSHKVLKPIGDQIELVLSETAQMPLLGISSYILSQFFYG